MRQDVYERITAKIVDSSGAGRAPVAQTVERGARRWALASENFARLIGSQQRIRT